MSEIFTTKEWKDRVSEYPLRRTLLKEDSSTEVVTVSRNEGTIAQEGDKFNAATMNDLEDRIGAAFINEESSVANRFTTTNRNVTTNTNSIATINKNAIKSITRSGTTFTATRLDGTTFTFTQQDTNTTYSLATISSSGLIRQLSGDTTNFLRGDGKWADIPTATSSVLGLVKVGSNISLSSGTISIPTASSATLGVIKVGSNITLSSGTISLTKTNVTDALGYTPPTTNTTYSNMTGATASAAGKSGLVPAPAAGKNLSFLRGDGTWVVPTNTTYSNATTSTAGLMSASDKTKLNGIASGAQVNTITGVKGNSESSYRTGNVNITKANIGLDRVGNVTIRSGTSAPASSLGENGDIYIMYS